MEQYLNALHRPCSIINLDFANENAPYEVAVDVRELISLDRVMEEFELGPNGGLVYCMEYLLRHFEWLEDKVQSLKGNYIIFDFPGQVELYSHHTCVHEILSKLTDRRGTDCRLCSVHLVDSHYCAVPETFISASLLVVASMLRLGLPHVNVLTKIDLLGSYGVLPFDLSYFTDSLDLTRMARYVGRPIPQSKIKDPAAFHGGSDRDNSNTKILSEDGENGEDGAERDLPELTKRQIRMAEKLCDVLNDFQMASFLPMSVQDGSTVGRVLGDIDLANGYSFAASAAESVKQHGEDSADSISHMFRLAADNLEPSYKRSLEIRERFEDPNLFNSS
jgi:hypothetical protein